MLGAAGHHPARVPAGTGRSGTASTGTSPSACPISNSMASDIRPAMRRGGRLTTNNAWRPTTSAGSVRSGFSADKYLPRVVAETHPQLDQLVRAGHVRHCLDRAHANVDPVDLVDRHRWLDGDGTVDGMSTTSRRTCRRQGSGATRRAPCRRPSCRAAPAECRTGPRHGARPRGRSRTPPWRHPKRPAPRAQPCTATPRPPGPTCADHFHPGWYVARPIVCPPRRTTSKRPSGISRTSSGDSNRLRITPTSMSSPRFRST